MAERILVLGNGPSAKAVDFKMISGPTIGMNVAYRYWDTIDWRPTYYCCLDNEVVVSHRDAIYRLIKEEKIKRFFLENSILKHYPELLQDKRIMWLEDVKDKHRYFKKTYLTTGSWSIRWAAYMGYDTIGFIGIDCNYVDPKNVSRLSEYGMKMLNNSAPDNYFFNGYQKKGDQFNIPNNPKYGNVHMKAMEKVKEEVDKQIYNLARNNVKMFDYGNLEEFY